MKFKIISLIMLILSFTLFIGCNRAICRKEGHDIVAATCTQSSYCKVCNKKFSDPLGHIWNEENVNTPIQCINCKYADFTKFNDYSSIPYDTNIGISIREIEHRYSKFATGNKNTLGEHEKSTFDLQITLVKLQTKTEINNIKLYVVAKTKDNGYCYKEYDENIKSMSQYTYTSVTDIENFAKKESISVNQIFNEEPIEIFVKITYNIGNGNINHTLTYKTPIFEVNEEKLFKAEFRDIISNNSTRNPSYVEPKDDPVRVKLTKKDANESSSLGSIKEDILEIKFCVLKENLNKYKHKDEYLKNNKLTSIELPKLEDEYTWDVYPEIKEIKFEIYAKIKSTDKDFSEYVKIYSIYGFLSKYRDLSIATSKLDESFDVEDIYIVVEGKLHNATKDTFNALYYCKYSELSNIN